MLLEASYKIATIFLLGRIQPIAEGLDKDQWWVLPWKRLTGHNLRCQNRREHGLKTWFLFLNLVKAFGRVPRELLWKVLEKLGVSQEVAQTLTCFTSRCLNI